MRVLLLAREYVRLTLLPPIQDSDCDHDSFPMCFRRIYLLILHNIFLLCTCIYLLYARMSGNMSFFISLFAPATEIYRDVYQGHVIAAKNRLYFVIDYMRHCTAAQRIEIYPKKYMHIISTSDSLFSSTTCDIIVL